MPEPPSGEGWIHEIKHDGYRTLIVIEGGKVRAFSRHGRDWTGPYRRVVEAATKLPCQAAIIDGEIIVQDENGISDFDACARPSTRQPHRIVFFAFDLLHLAARIYGEARSWTGGQFSVGEAGCEGWRWGTRVSGNPEDDRSRRGAQMLCASTRQKGQNRRNCAKGPPRRFSSHVTASEHYIREPGDAAQGAAPVIHLFRRIRKLLAGGLGFC